MCKLRRLDGTPVTGARVRVAVGLSRPGEISKTDEATEVEPGSYLHSVNFTAGDWTIVVTAVLPDGRTFERKLDVPRVGGG